ncbi:hypothetical protein K2X14_13915 [Acetobacter sp. TBRC 12305]|uniref:Uncharacterized protein n=1 Tax=Acetobacter garciniae TaxID=2817435 RepID=A0A939KRE3_9PROT|nr:hypothetical protein [Acetobacter garciniae]MBO1326814.1 hypothetical protein [Acetobacter garciniae]MBX0345930.1 hypothetical protein [Acetobacter garciniae]
MVLNIAYVCYILLCFFGISLANRTQPLSVRSDLDASSRQTALQLQGFTMLLFACMVGALSAGFASAIGRILLLVHLADPSVVSTERAGSMTVLRRVTLVVAGFSGLYIGFRAARVFAKLFLIGIFLYVVSAIAEWIWYGGRFQF